MTTMRSPYPDTMSALIWTVSVLFLVDDSKAAPPPYVTLHPDQRTIFQGDKVTLTCNVAYPTGRGDENIRWYKDDKPIKIYTQKIDINSAELIYSGNYQCETTGSNRSDPVRLEVSNDWLILQVPLYIYEGDRMRFKCRGWDSLFSSEVRIYKDDKIIRNVVNNLDKTRSGVYKCTRKRLLFYYTSNEVYVLVQDLFSAPVLGLAPPLVSEGDEMTLTCDTTLVPLRSTTILMFSFYKNEQNVQEFSPNNNYRVSSAQLEHSGKYSCEVKTLSDTVRKVSAAVDIQVQESLKPPVLEVSPSAAVSRGDQVVLRCVTSPPAGRQLLFGFFRDSLTVRDYTASDTFTIPAAEDGHSGTYRCSTKPEDKEVLKFSEDVNIVVKSEKTNRPPDNGADGKKNIEKGAAVGRPRLTLSPDMVAVGDEITLRCESSQGIPPIHYRFYHNGAILGNVTVHQTRTGEIRRVIRSVTRTGPYHCDSRQDISPVIWQSGAIILSIVDPVANISITMENDDEDFTFGQPVTLTCSVQRGTSPSFLWLHNGKVIERGSMVYQLKDDQKRLHIDSLQSHHAGAYRCNASNKLPPDRMFSVLSDPRIISVTEPSPADSAVLPVFLGLALLTVLTAVPGFMYRHKISPLFASCATKHLKTEGTKEEARTTQNPRRDISESSLDVGQEDYSNIPSRNHVVCENVCYSEITINRVKEASPHSSKGNEEFSVTYSAVKLSQPTPDPRPTHGRPDCADLYQNLHTKRLQS